ncbi:PREDICTED: uncharacterized protein LOC105954603 [Erythranthe guttata]|uniref:uncharacterized protein LOC105954603 n=1 Tax=Erythranthe guttata TaxID=4155 RepID=UPI00064DB153|nr:PREDICTED: uncharacterized protein LOC105954603 [Erythranthe guttata]|eukprot:XP_012833722.1 PREDICTED: uncharacterized protein LOC105954603 [Erythranthe guttata]
MCSMADELDVGKHGYACDNRLFAGTTYVAFFKYRVKPNHVNYVLDVNVLFIVRKINGEDEIIGSERYTTDLYAPEEPNCELTQVFKHRLEEYWISEEQLAEFKQKLFDLAKEKDSDPKSRALNSIIVEIDVVTLQQVGEKIDATMKRAMKKENLLPLYIWPFESINGHRPGYVARPGVTNVLKFLLHMRRNRVSDLYSAWTMMRICRLCNDGPNWSQMTIMDCCKRAYHSKCIFRQLLLTSNYCPSCNSQVYDPCVVFNEESSSQVMPLVLFAS